MAYLIIQPLNKHALITTDLHDLFSMYLQLGLIRQLKNPEEFILQADRGEQPYHY